VSPSFNDKETHTMNDTHRNLQHAMTSFAYHGGLLVPERRNERSLGSWLRSLFGARDAR
jgi:hypothetical protein